MSVSNKTNDNGKTPKYDVIFPRVERYAVMLSLEFSNPIAFPRNCTIYQAVEMVTAKAKQKNRVQRSQMIATRITLNYAERCFAHLESIYCEQQRIRIALSFENVQLLERFTRNLNAMIEESVNYWGPLVNDIW